MKTFLIVCCLLMGGAFPLGCATSQFNRGDAIVIDEIQPSLKTLKVGQTIVVRGHYSLASRPRARLMISLTTYRSGAPTRVSPLSQREVSAGSGSFELEYEVRDAGALHISFYEFPAGGNFGRLDIKDVGF